MGRETLASTLLTLEPAVRLWDYSFSLPLADDSVDVRS